MILLASATFLLLHCSRGDQYGVNAPDREESLKAELQRILEEERFVADRSYEPLSLKLEGKPISLIGRTIDDAESKLHLSLDPNGPYSSHESVVDYFSTSSKLGTRLVEDPGGSINGILSLHSIRKDGRIFGVSGVWTFDFDASEGKARDEARRAIVKSFFPALSGKLKIEDGWQYDIEKPTLTEHFKITTPQSSGNYIKLHYDVRLNNSKDQKGPQ